MRWLQADTPAWFPEVSTPSRLALLQDINVFLDSVTSSVWKIDMLRILTLDLSSPSFGRHKKIMFSCVKEVFKSVTQYDRVFTNWTQG